jgi:phage-related protein
MSEAICGTERGAALTPAFASLHPGYTPNVSIEQSYKNWYIRIVDELKPVIWIGSSRRDLRAMPPQVRRDIGQALYAAQQGVTDPSAKPLKGFLGTRVMEIVERHQTDAYRAVYTAHFETAIYVLHVFQKKSKKGIATPLQDIKLIRKRFAEAQQDHKARQN